MQSEEHLEVGWQGLWSGWKEGVDWSNRDVYVVQLIFKKDVKKGSKIWGVQLQRRAG